MGISLTFMEVERSAKCKCRGSDVEMPKRLEFIAGVVGGSVILLASASANTFGGRRDGGYASGS